MPDPFVANRMESADGKATDERWRDGWRDGELPKGVRYWSVSIEGSRITARLSRSHGIMIDPIRIAWGTSSGAQRLGRGHGGTGSMRSACRGWLRGFRCKARGVATRDAIRRDAQLYVRVRRLPLLFRRSIFFFYNYHTSYTLFFYTIDLCKFTLARYFLSFLMKISPIRPLISFL